MDSVPLKDFVAESLKAISLGVADAQEAARAGGGIPIGLYSVGNERVVHGEQLVKFTISVQAESRSEKVASASASAAIISVITGKVDASASSGAVKQNLHTIEFSVPMHFDSRWPMENT